MSQTANRPAAGRFGSLLGSSVAILIMTIWICRFFLRPLGHDQTLLLFEADRFLGGAQIYGPRLVETNPPLIIWLSVVPVVLARHLHVLSAAAWFRTLVLVAICVSVSWCVGLLRRGGWMRNGLDVALFGLVVLAVDLSMSAYDSGQREHLLILLLVPYLLAVATGAVERLSTPERVLLGSAAAVAIWLKPQDTVIVIALELVCAFRLRSLRRLLNAEVIAMVGTALGLLALVLLLTPLYVQRMVPVLSDTYWALGTNTTATLLLGSHLYLAGVLGVVLCCALLWRRLRDRWTPVVLLACSLAAYFAYAIQHTNWPYHQFPHRALFALAVTSLVLDVADPWLRRVAASRLLTGQPALAIAGGCLLLGFLLALQPRMARSHLTPPTKTPVDSLFAQLPPKTTVMALSTGVPVLASAYEHDLQWGSRFAHLWMLPAIVDNEMGENAASRPFKQLSPQRTAALAGLLRGQVADDLNFSRPQVVLVPHCTRATSCQALEGRDFDTLAWFERGPGFAQAWTPYERQTGIEGFDVYRRVR